MFRQGDRYGFIDGGGHVVIPPRFGYALGFSEGLAAVEMEAGERPRYGFIDLSGECRIAPQFEYVSSFSDGRAAVTRPGNAEWGVIDTKGRWIVEPKYDAISEFRDGLAQVLTADGGIHVIDREGRVLFRDSRTGRFTEADLRVASEGLIPVPKGGRWGFVNNKGELVIPATYERASPFSDGMALVRVATRDVFIDHTGQVVFDVAERVNTQLGTSDTPVSVREFQDGMARVLAGEGFGYLDKTGKLAIRSVYAQADHFRQGVAPVLMDGKWGLIDKAGSVVLPGKFDEVGTVSEGVIPVKKGGRWGVLSTAGSVIVDPQFERIWPCANGIVCAMLQGKCGFIDKTGKILTKWEFDSLPVL